MVEERPSEGDGSTMAKHSSRSERSISKEIIKRRYGRTPIGLYHLKDRIIDIISTGSFVDSLLMMVAFMTVVSFLGFYPLSIIVIILIVLFAATLYRPFLGLILLNVALFPIYIYQTPLLAWVFLVAAAAILIYGYKHYRLAVFIYALVGMAFSPLGYLFAIPLFLFAILTIGNKRSMIMMVASVLLIIMFSGITGLQNTGYIVYNAAAAHATIFASGGSSMTILSLDAPSKPSLTLFTFGPGLVSAFSNFFSYKITSQIPDTGGVFVQALMSNPIYYLLQMVVLAALIMVIDWYATNSRLKFKGAYSSLFGIVYPISYLLLAKAYTNEVSIMMVLASFVIAPLLFYMFEYYDINIVRVLDVKKQDIRMKFGEAFEDLAGGDVSERFDDIGNYESTKRELREAIIQPIEQRGVSQAYNIKPTKGILFFGPPGTGKTMMMRALANEIHGGFFYVKANNLISAYPGESERMVTNIFSIAKKNVPCVLFLDEIDSLAMSRENSGLDDSHRHALSQLLVEMDGFEKINNVVIVGATNRPDLLDTAILRPGRFDKLIYLPLPDVLGRKKIFDIYLKRLPVADDVSSKQLADKTERYSGADIKAVCESVAQMTAQEATKEHKILQITQADMLGIVRSSKPSTTLAQLDEYRKFKIDFERRTFQETTEEAPQIMMDSVIGLGSAKKAIRDAIQLPLMHPELIKKYDIKTINGLLLFGPPGTGKTMLMRAVSNEMKGITMLEITGSELEEQGLERATATIKEIFNRAKENAPSVIFIDEVDSVIARRQSATEIGAQITSELLTELDGIRQMSSVVVVGATNKPDSLDSAILRPGRFDKLVFVKPPNSAQRIELFKYYLKNVPCAPLQYDKLADATKGYTGADIAAVCREAKSAALESELHTGTEGKISMQTLLTIIGKTRPSAPDDVVAQYAEFLSKYGQR
jgi:SpoVK/Ycf46/Vps4 family AAA+-type ATPase